MTIEEKLAMLKSILRIDNNSEDATLTAYLNMAKSALLGWRYSNSANTPDDVPTEYEMTQIQAVVNGFTQSGIEGQTVSVENGIHRHFEFSDMVRYIKGNVIAFAKVPGRSATPSGGDEDVSDAVAKYVDDNAITV